jgi:predicted phosphodiesterase
VSRRKQKRTFSQVVIWGLSVIMVLSMVVSLVIVALPGPAEPVPTPAPTWTPRPTASPQPSPSPTEPAVVPAVPTATVTITATAPLELAPPLQPTAAPAVAATVVRIAAAPATATVTPTAEASLTFAVVGDSRHNPQVYGRVLAAVARSSSEFVVHTGDLVDVGSEEQWQVFEQSMAGFPLPFYPVPGNHDGLGGKLDGYLAHSRAPAAHYSLDRGPVHLAMADTHNGGVSAAELAWLRDDLSRTTQPIKMVFMHHPPFDPDGTDHIMAYGNEAVMALMAEMDVDYVFAGHIHAYVQGERDGVSYYITGGGGAPLYAGDHPQAVHHYLLVTVQGQAVTVEMVRV